MILLFRVQSAQLLLPGSFINDSNKLVLPSPITKTTFCVDSPGGALYFA